MTTPRPKRRTGRYGKVYADLLTESKLHDLMALKGGKEAFAAWALGTALVAKELSDGRVKRSQLRVIFGTEKDAALLVQVGLWVEHADGWEFAKYVEGRAGITRADVEALKRDGEVSACKGWMAKGKPCSCGGHLDADPMPNPQGEPVGNPSGLPSTAKSQEPRGLKQWSSNAADSASIPADDPTAPTFRPVLVPSAAQTVNGTGDDPR